MVQKEKSIYFKEQNFNNFIKELKMETSVPTYNVIKSFTRLYTEHNIY